MTTPTFQHATAAYRTVCGPDAVSALPVQLDRFGVKRAVVFCGQSMVRRHGDTLGQLDAALKGRVSAWFDRVQAQSPVAIVEAGRDVLAEVSGDAVVAVGGGSAIVTARAASILFAERRDVRELCTRR
jgi:alcohol dehydrogenase class IV